MTLDDLIEVLTGLRERLPAAGLAHIADSYRDIDPTYDRGVMRLFALPVPADDDNFDDYDRVRQQPKKVPNL